MSYTAIPQLTILQNKIQCIRWKPESGTDGTEWIFNLSKHSRIFCRIRDGRYEVHWKHANPVEDLMCIDVRGQYPCQHRISTISYSISRGCGHQFTIIFIEEFIETITCETTSVSAYTIFVETKMKQQKSLMEEMESWKFPNLPSNDTLEECRRKNEQAVENIKELKQIVGSSAELNEIVIVHEKIAEDIASWRTIASMMQMFKEKKVDFENMVEYFKTNSFVAIQSNDAVAEEMID